MKIIIKIMIIIIIVANVTVLSQIKHQLNANIYSRLRQAKYIEEVFEADSVVLKIPIEYYYNIPKTFIVTKDNKIFMSFKKGSEVLEFNSEGKFIKAFGRRGEGPGEFIRPWHIDVMNDKLIVGDETLRRLTIYNIDGALEKTEKISHPINSLNVISDSLIVMDDYYNARINKKRDIYIHNALGEILYKFGKLTKMAKKLYVAPVHSNWELITTYENDIYVGEFSNYKLIHYKNNGRMIKVFGKCSAKWNSMINTNIKKMTFSDLKGRKLQQFLEQMKECSRVYWINSCDPGIVLMYYGLNKKNMALIAIYDLDGNLINVGLKIKSKVRNGTDNSILVVPVKNRAFGLYIETDRNNDILNNNKIVNIKFVTFMIPPINN